MKNKKGKIKGKIIRAVGGHFVRVAKALVVSKPIAIFHPRDGKS